MFFAILIIFVVYKLFPNSFWFAHWVIIIMFLPPHNYGVCLSEASNHMKFD
jgi:hypothetical protein